MDRPRRRWLYRLIDMQHNPIPWVNGRFLDLLGACLWPILGFLIGMAYTFALLTILTNSSRRYAATHGLSVGAAPAALVMAGIGVLTGPCRLMLFICGCMCGGLYVYLRLPGVQCACACVCMYVGSSIPLTVCF